MSLTGAPLIVVAILGVVATAAATVLLWARGGRLRFLLRTLGVLLTEALLMLSVGLVVNRSQGFYPTWSALRQTAETSGTTYATKPGHLDPWLLGYAGAHPDRSAAFTWQPTGWTGWGLSGAPTVVAPAGYLQHPTWRYSALLVIDTGTWTAAAETAATRDAGLAADPAIIVFVRTTPSTTARALATALPAALAGDLRVTGRRWALVASAGAAKLARQAVVAAPVRYPAVAFVPGGAAPGGAAPVSPSLPAGIATAVVGTTPAAPATSAAAVRPVHLPAGATTALVTALTWACRQTPPPLAASAPSVTHLPVHRRSRHHRVQPSPEGSAPAILPGGSHVPGQPGR